MGFAYERKRFDPQWSADPLTQDQPTQLPLINTDTGVGALDRPRKEWERLPWSHVPIDNSQAESPKMTYFQPPTAQPSLASIYSSQQRNNPNGFQVANHNRI